MTALQRFCNTVSLCQVLAIVGDDQRAFGRDVGRNTEGPRNHVDSFKYKADDGTDRLRIRMNIKGGTGKVRVWAEVCVHNAGPTLFVV